MAYILIAEDNTDLRKSLEDLLQSMGHTVVAASSAIEALNVLLSASNTFNLVITDWRMPRKDDGLELLQFLNAGHYTGPVIVHSGEEDPRYPLTLLQEAFESFASLQWVMKNGDSIIPAIQQALEKQKPPQ